ncbi:MAG TPA: family 10 glycosylhydrolase [Sphingobacteriaceae bacterium]|nr:family 10 glycosylhydrolase [Sphingobacteriaceae bacterium]
MYTKLIIAISCLYSILTLSCCSNSKPVVKDTWLANPPKAETEFRAAWVATVANINWPSKPGLSTEEQQREAITLLDFLKQNNFNAVVFQVRPQTDALYKSNLEPWSYFLTGEQGKAPDPYYDPLEFWTEAAHDRGLEMHVWLNPYRAHHISGGPVTDKSFAKNNPELVVKLKEGYLWLDPSKKGTQDHSAAVVMDLVKRYDIDGVHFDDYFYPYPSYNGTDDFPDDDSWKAYQNSGGKLLRSDWRRESVNKFIERLYKEIKAEKKYVKFGISPFGIWRPGYPESIQGLDQYDKLYADARLWLNKGWIDYFAPQLYWEINKTPQSFPVLLGWWAKENTKARHLWPGINVGRGGDEKNINETINQIMITRAMVPTSKGVIHWSISSLTKHQKLTGAILAGPYKNDALVPASSWLDNKPPAPPSVTTTLQQDNVKISWAPAYEKDIFRWVVYTKYGTNWTYKILNRKDRALDIKRFQGENASRLSLNSVAVTTVDRTGNESAFKEVLIK